MLKAKISFFYAALLLSACNNKSQLIESVPLYSDSLNPGIRSYVHPVELDSSFCYDGRGHIAVRWEKKIAFLQKRPGENFYRIKVDSIYLHFCNIKKELRDIKDSTVLFSGISREIEDFQEPLGLPTELTLLKIK